jgi:multidrug transporter EmrE-like cation transporter
MIRNIVLLLAILANVGAQLSLRFGMRSFNINRKSNILETLLEIIKNWYVWQGLILYGVGFSLYLYILSKFEVSFIYPIITASIFILLLTFSSLILNESITVKKVISITIIIIGIFIASS